MNALSYLVRKQIRNGILDVLRHPSKLIIYIAAVAFFVMMLLPSAKGQAATRPAMDLRLLEGIFYGLLLLFSVTTLFSSLKSGTTMFKMPDVNFLFVSPLAPKRILFYGILKQMGTTLLGFVFLLFYSGMLMQYFRISAQGVVSLILCAVVLSFEAQMLALLLYSWTNGDEKRRTGVRAALYAFFAAMALVLLWSYQKNGGGLEGLFAAFASPELKMFPLVGWAEGAAFAFIAGNLSGALLWCGLLAAAFALVLCLFLRSDTDYYEDVLQRTETLHETKQAAMENRVSMNASFGKKVRTGKTGLGRGWGANAFFYRQLCEARRRSRLLLLDPFSFILLALDMGVYFMMTRSGDGPSAEQAMITLLGIDVYLLFLTSAVGDWARELAKPYIYLAPEPPFQKLLWSSLTTILKPAADGALVFLVMGIVSGAGSAFICFLGYASYGLLFLSGNVLSQRVLGRLSNRGLMVFLFLLILLVLAVPGILAGVFTWSALPALPDAARFCVAGLPTVGWNILVALLILYFCRNLLATAEAK